VRQYQNCTKETYTEDEDEENIIIKAKECRTSEDNSDEKQDLAYPEK